MSMNPTIMLHMPGWCIRVSPNFMTSSNKGMRTGSEFDCAEGSVRFIRSLLFRRDLRDFLSV